MNSSDKWVRTQGRLPDNDGGWVHCLVAVAGVSVETAVYKPYKDEWMSYPSGKVYMQPPEYWRPAPDPPRSVKAESRRIPGRHPLQCVGKAPRGRPDMSDGFKERIARKEICLRVVRHHFAGPPDISETVVKAGPSSLTRWKPCENCGKLTPPESLEEGLCHQCTS